MQSFVRPQIFVVCEPRRRDPDRRRQWAARGRRGYRSTPPAPPGSVSPVTTSPSAMVPPLPRQAPAGLRALTFLSGSCTSRSTRSRCPETMERTIQLVSQEGLPVARKVWQRVSPGWPCFADLGSVRQFVHCTKMLKQASSPTSAASLCNWLRLLHDGSNLLPRPTESGRPGRV